MGSISGHTLWLQLYFCPGPSSACIKGTGWIQFVGLVFWGRYLQAELLSVVNPQAEAVVLATATDAAAAVARDAADGSDGEGEPAQVGPLHWCKDLQKTSPPGGGGGQASNLGRGYSCKAIVAKYGLCHCHSEKRSDGYSIAPGWEENERSVSRVSTFGGQMIVIRAAKVS